ncbi:hypothetical protein BDV28DRAFT_1560 [Aspergillus coremiiformis]|uniref:Cyanovirin-N domain-containing protein n=1 Tax=Aspergillus coremiiformis TaxID=138285 RepID=A0A5N6ZHB3_9EURO|nr:hypothetical protein BDV28DRAFT_1560 [Aspergillus coremiiformis]
MQENMHRLLLILIISLSALVEGDARWWPSSKQPLPSGEETMSNYRTPFYKKCRKFRFNSRYAPKYVLTGECLPLKGDPMKAKDWRESGLDLDRCVGWDVKARRLTSQSNGAGLVKGACQTCDYKVYISGAENRGNLACYCNARTSWYQRFFPSRLAKDGPVNLELDSVLWTRDGHLNCHEHQGS